MVPKKISGRKTRKIKRLKIVGGIFLGVFVLTLSALIAIKSISNPVETNDSRNESAVQNSDEAEVESEPTGPIEIIKKVDFQPTVDLWVSKTDGNKGILIYDLANGEVVGSYNIDQNFNTASLYKLFVVYEGYRRVGDGIWDGEAKAGST
ncbi:MAG: hypothetical protein Q4B29_02900, partial [Candidatus Saccharibacteria bacterium]|nr:hypothetical protein [Candidatus Saccharibacteria bacterium]